MQNNKLYKYRQKYLIILTHNCEENCKTRSIDFAHLFKAFQSNSVID